MLEFLFKGIQMTFSRIKSVGWQVNEKVTSAQLNQLDLDHSRSVDKTGDNVSTGGGVTGEIDWLTGSVLKLIDGYMSLTSSSSLNFDNSSQIVSNVPFTATLTNPTIFQNAQVSDVAAGNLNVHAADAYPSASFYRAGGNLILSSGNAVAGGVNGSVYLQVGHDGAAQQVFAANSSETVISGGGIYSIVCTNSLLQLASPIQFNAGFVPSIGQAQVSSGNGSNLPISAQGTTATSGIGGDLILNGGEAINGYPGNVKIDVDTHSDAFGSIQFQQDGTTHTYASKYTTQWYPVGSTGQSLLISPWIGTVNTQNAAYQVEKFLLHSTAGGSNTIFTSVTIPNNCTAKFTFDWCVKSTAGSTSNGGNFTTFFASANGSGSVSYEAGFYNINTAAWDANSYFTVSVSTNTINFLIIPPAGSALDWCIVMTTLLN